MTRKTQAADAPFRPIRDTGAVLSRVEPEQIAAALGAEEAPARLGAALAPVTLFAVREELVKRLQSSGGRPALEGATRRAKIPLNDAEWFQLEDLAAAVASPGFAPSAGQVASVLLSLALHTIALRATPAKPDSPLMRELAAKIAAEPR